MFSLSVLCGGLFWIYSETFYDAAPDVSMRFFMEGQITPN